MSWRRVLDRIRAEPLALFLAGGALIVAANALLGPALGLDDIPRRIEVTRADLVRFTQLRARAFSEERASESFDAMSEAKKRELLAQYLREEALYREAVELGLDRQDYVVRRRIVQSMEYALGSQEGEARVPDDGEVRAWYDAHKELYSLPSVISFSHVYFGGPQAKARAIAALPVLTGGQGAPEEMGDRFLYTALYLKRTEQEVAGHFGAAMAHELFDQSRSGSWIGPLASIHGYHLVRVEQVEQGGLQPFEQAKAKATQDAMAAARKASIERNVAETLARYRVVLSSGLENLR
jgi:peptidyl-prolyl cis-trans isomerase C